jgi:predicted P-loop ATPase
LVSRGLLARDVAFDAFWDAAKRAGLAEDESRKTINSGLNGSAKLLVDEPPFPDWTKYGPRRDSLDNVRALLAHLNIELRYNEFASRAEITGFKSYAILNDNVVDELWGQCNEFGFQPSQNHLRNSLRTIALENSFHPVRDYFDNLEWDGQKRLDTWLTNYLGAEDSKYTRSVSAKTLIAAARRIYEPGTKFDQIVVLEGIQGTEKSSALELLAIKKAWFTDDFSLTDDSRKILEQTEGKLIVESSELIGGRRADANHIKAMLSRTHDRARKAYGYFVTEVPRQFIFIGTTNEKKYLVDPTGNRRFWPVQTDRIDTKGLKSDVDQLWAEAVHRHRQGESIVLPKELWEAARQEQEKRTFEDPWRLALEDVLGNVNGKVPTSDVWTLIGKPTPKDRTQYDNNHLGEVMRELGWTRTKLQYKKKLQNCYVRGVEPHPEISIQSTPFGQPSVQVAKEQPNDEHREY